MLKRGFAGVAATLRLHIAASKASQQVKVSAGIFASARKQTAKAPAITTASDLITVDFMARAQSAEFR